MTAIRWAWRAVLRRWAITIEVFPRSRASTFCQTRASVPRSSELVGSSRITIGASRSRARARASRCLCPARGLPHLLERYVGSESDVLRDRGVEQDRVLEHERDLGT